MTMAYAAQHRTAYRTITPRNPVAKVLGSSPKSAAIAGFSDTRSPTIVPMSGMSVPVANHIRPSPRQLHRSAMRCWVQASANGPRSDAFASARPLRVAIMPPPKSRRDARIAASHSSRRMATTLSAIGHQRRSTNARVCWAQAIGENQDSVVPPGISRRFPATWIANARPNTARDSPVAPRPCSDSWLSTSAIAPNTIELSATPTVMPSESAIGSSSMPPAPVIASAETSAMTTLTSTSVTTAATAGACRPTTAARTSSDRLDSSSARVWRTTCRMLMIDSASTIQTVPSFAIDAPTV